MPGVAAPNYFGSVDQDENMALDPYFFAVDNDLTAFGNGLDDFVTDQSHP